MPWSSATNIQNKYAVYFEAKSHWIHLLAVIAFLFVCLYTNAYVENILTVTWITFKLTNTKHKKGKSKQRTEKN